MNVKYLLLRCLSTFALFLCVFTLLYVAANGPAMYSLSRYTVSPPTIPPTPAATAAPAVSTPTAIDPTPRIKIPKIGVDAPISWDIAGGDATLPYLDAGVAQLKDSGEPGQPGNLFLTGHSSDYPWKHNPYSTVFTLISKLQIGDIILITKNGSTYSYAVTGSRVVSPDDLSVTKSTSTSTISLMTCTPIGTTARRRIVTGSFVSTDPAQ